MKRYIAVYKRLFLMNFSSLLAYRAHFISSLISSTAWALFTFISIFLLTAKTPMVFGWEREKIIFLSAIYAVYYGFFQMVFAKNFENMAVLIDTGELDKFFLKPIDAQFLTSCLHIGITSFIRVPIGMIFMYVFGKQLGIYISMTDALLFILALFCSLTLLYTVWMSILLCLIWNPRLSNLVEVLFTLSGMSRYPSEMYRSISEILMYVLLPLTLTTVIPVTLLFHTVTPWEYVFFIVLTIVFFIVSRLFWLFALRSYSSASN